MTANSVAERPLNRFPEGVGGSLLGDQTLNPQYEPYRADPVVSGLLAVFAEGRKNFDNVKKAVATRDPTLTEHGQFIDNHSRAYEKFEVWGKRRESEARRAASEVVAIDNDIERKLEIREGTYSAEIRADFKSLKPNVRLSDAMKAIEAADATTLAAILAAPARLSGFSDADQAMIRSRYAEKHAPDLIARKKAIVAAANMIEAASIDAIKAYGAIFPHATVAEIKARMAEARKARDDI